MPLKPITIFHGVRMTKDPELVQRGNLTTSLVLMSVAYNERFKAKDQTVKDRAHFYDLEFWGTKADYLMKYGHKGALLDASCFPKHDTWTGDDNKKKSRLMFLVNEFSFVNTKTMGSSGKKSEDTDTGFPSDDDARVDSDDNVPF